MYKERCALLITLLGPRKPIQYEAMKKIEENKYELDCLSNAAENIIFLNPNYPNVIDKVFPCVGGSLECQNETRILSMTQVEPWQLTHENFENLIENYVQIKDFTYCDTGVGHKTCVCPETGNILVQDSCGGICKHKIISTGN